MMHGQRNIKSQRHLQE